MKELSVTHGTGWIPQLTLRAVLKTIVWVAIVTIALIFVSSEARRYLAINPESYGPFWKNRFFVLPHFVAGSVALLLGPFQFWSGARKRYFRLHRIIGRIYLGSIVIAASSAYYLAFNSVVGWMLGVTLFMLASAWVTCASMAYVSIRNGRVKAHKEWMIRTYVLTFSFVTVRVLLSTPLFLGASLQERFTILGWLGWAVPLFITEVALQWRNSVTPNTRTSNSRPENEVGI